MSVCWKEEKKLEAHTHFCARRCGREIGKAENEKDLSLAGKGRKLSDWCGISLQIN